MERRHLNKLPAEASGSSSPERRTPRDQIRMGSQGDHLGESSQNSAGQKKITDFTRYYFENQYRHHRAADQPGVQQVQARGDARGWPFHQQEPWSDTPSEQAPSRARNPAIEQVHTYPVYFPALQAFCQYSIGGGDPSWPYAFQDLGDQHSRLFFTQQQDDPRYPLGQFYRLSREENRQDRVRLPTAEQLVFLEQQEQQQSCSTLPRAIADSSCFEASSSKIQAPSVSEANHQTPRGFVSDALQEPLKQAEAHHSSSDRPLELPKPLPDIPCGDEDLATQYLTFNVPDHLANPQQYLQAIDPYKTSISSWTDLLTHDLDTHGLLFPNRPSQEEHVLPQPQEETFSLSDYLTNPSPGSSSEPNHHCQSFPDDTSRKRKHNEVSSSMLQATSGQTPADKGLAVVEQAQSSQAVYEQQNTITQVITKKRDGQKGYAKEEARLAEQGTTPYTRIKAKLAEQGTTPGKIQHAREKARLAEQGTTPHARKKARLAEQGTTDYARRKARSAEKGTTPYARRKARLAEKGTTPYARRKARSAEKGTTPYAIEKARLAKQGTTPGKIQHTREKVILAEQGTTPHARKKARLANKALLHMQEKSKISKQDTTSHT